MQNHVPAIQLLAIDIDGTLLDPHKRITPRTLQAIQAARQQGIIVTLATARRYYNTLPIAQELGLEIPLVLCDGALIVQHPEGMRLSTCTLSAEVAQQAVDILVHHHVQPVVQHINGKLEESWTGPAPYDNPWVEGYFEAYPYALRRLPLSRLCTGHPDPLRVVAFTSEDTAHAITHDLAALDCSWNVTRRGSYNTAEVAIMHRNCSKASGVLSLAQLLHIEVQAIMAIGDNNNDSEMLQAVGWGVAMGHAPEPVKAVAQAVTASNTEDGVALAIERYALRDNLSADSNSLNRATCL